MHNGSDVGKLFSSQCIKRSKYKAILLELGALNWMLILGLCTLSIIPGYMANECATVVVHARCGCGKGTGTWVNGR